MKDALRRSIPWYSPTPAAICELLSVARRTFHPPGNRFIGF
jgi:hypothetical protein